VSARRARWVLTLGLLLGAAPAAAQDARLAAIPDAEARAAIGALIVAAEQRGLPREPLVTKALEGVEKGAAGPRIVAAVQAMSTRLLAARTALAPAASPAELDAAAGAIAAGVPADAIRIVRQAAPNRSITVALGVLAQLAARGIPPESAAQAVAQLVQRGASHPQLLTLQRTVQDDLAKGVPPSTALDLRFRAVVAALPPPGPPTGAATLSPAGGKPTARP